MELPITVTLERVQEAPRDRRGRYHVRRRDTMGLGVVLEVTCDGWGHMSHDAWTHAALPKRQFATYAQLREALLAAPDEAVQAELQKWPQVARRSATALSAHRRCSACEASKTDAPMPAVISAFVSMNWRIADDRFVMLCPKHAPLLATPRELIAVIDGSKGEPA